MTNYLDIVNRIIEEHRNIRTRIRLLGNTMSDRESLGILDDARSGWIPGRLDLLIEKRSHLQEAISLLSGGLKNHFAFEERVLPALLGEYLMRALVLDHQAIKEELEKIGRTLSDVEIPKLNREQILATEMTIQQAVNSISGLIEDHASREEIVLGMLKKALEHQTDS